MASVNVAVHGTLVATTVATNTLNDVRGSVTVTNRSGSADIYFTVAGSGATPTAPTVGGNDCYVVPGAAGTTKTVQVGNAPAVVSLISSGTPTYSIEAASPTLVVER